jgi:hypothetical protein
MAINRNRELSQIASVVIVDDANKNVGIATTSAPKVGIGLTDPSYKLDVVGVGVTRASTDDVNLMKNVPIPQGSSFEFMGGNKVVLETTDTFTAVSDVNNSLDVALTIMEIT